jgi:hypothetical protein
MAMFSRLLVTLAGLAALSACATPAPPPPQAGSLDAGFGEVTKYNAAVQIIDPDPVYTAEGAKPGDSGVKGAEAVKRYRTDQVKETESASSTRRAGARGGGGGSGPR